MTRQQVFQANMACIHDLLDALLDRDMVFVDKDRHKSYLLSQLAPRVRLLTGPGGTTAAALDSAELAPGDRVFFFKPSFQLNTSARGRGLQPLQQDIRTRSFIENKVRFYERALPTFGPLFPAAVTGTAADMDFDRVVSKTGLPFVLQFASGFSGRSTYLVSSRSQFRDLAAGKRRKAKASRYVPGTVWTANGFMHPSWFMLAPPFEQYTADHDLTPFALGSCGNLFAQELPPGHDFAAFSQQVRRLLQHVAFQGFFGIDFVMQQNRCRLIEVNPRYTTTMSLESEISLLGGTVPCLILDILRLGMPAQAQGWQRVMDQVRHTQKRLKTHLVGRPAQLIVYSRHSAYTPPEVASGVYRIQDGQLQHISSSPFYHDLDGRAFALLAPEPGRRIGLGYEVARIIFDRQQISLQHVKAAALPLLSP